MNVLEKKREILELCSEDAYGSWEFWSDAKNKTEAEAGVIVQAIQELVSEKLIVPTEGTYVKGHSYQEILLDADRLTHEVMLSIPFTVDPDTFYWFYATEKGKEQDIKKQK